MNRRVAIICDGRKWYIRRIRVIEHDLDRDEKVYRCDAPLGGPYKKAIQALLALKRGRLKPAPPRARG